MGALRYTIASLCCGVSLSECCGDSLCTAGLICVSRGMSLYHGRVCLGKRLCIIWPVCPSWGGSVCHGCLCPVETVCVCGVSLYAVGRIGVWWEDSLSHGFRVL